MKPLRVLFLSEVQWRAQVSRKHQLARRFPPDWRVLFVSPFNARRQENSPRLRTDPDFPHVSHVSLPLPKPDSRFAIVRGLSGALAAAGGLCVDEAVRRFQPDVVVCSYIWAAAMLPRLRARGLPVVYDLNDLHCDFFPSCPQRANAAFARLLREADEVVASSRRLADIAARGVVLGNGVDLDTFQPQRAGPPPGVFVRSALADRRDLAVYMGSVDTRLDETLLEAVLERSGQEFGLLCVGGVHHEAEPLKRRLELRFPGRVLFAGRVPYAELPSWLALSRVGLLPFVASPRTGAINPNKLYIYAAMGLNIVATPFSPEVASRCEDVFLASGPRDFAAAVLCALTDDTRRPHLRRRLAEPHSWDTIAGDYADLLRAVVAGRAKSAQREAPPPV
ncbi:MAG: glycosyltransferase [Candidatus Latescibacteria bacterium]|nr:glycosyltransferase [Candidatus Latescibacterota bacterium]